MKTDYFHEPAYPTYLYFNPYDENKEIHIEVGTRRVDLYDAVGKRWVKKAVQGRVGLRLGRDSAAVIVQVPATARTVLQGAKLLADGVVVDYYASAT